MKPPAFGYAAPHTLDEALLLASEYADDGRLLAGGQSLMPVLNFRLASPTVLIDLNQIAELSGIFADSAGGLTIGAMTRHRALERSSEIAQYCPLIATAMPHVAHVQIRNRGTIGGSIAHADPAAELPAIALACGAVLVIKGMQGERVLPASSFFLGLLTTALCPGEILTAIRLPPWPANRRWGFLEVTRRHGDFALAGAAVWFDGGDRVGAPCTSARIVLFGVGDTPIRAAEAERHLIGREPDDGVFREAARLAAAALDPPTDVHASAEYRREVGAVMVRRALEQARQRDPLRQAA